MNRGFWLLLPLCSILVLVALWGPRFDRLGEVLADTSNNNEILVDLPEVDRVPDALTPVCGAAQVDLSSSPGPSLDIEIPESRSWIRNLSRAYLSQDQVIRPEFKKNFAARVTIRSPGEAPCTLPASIRLTGDFKDHIDLDQFAGSLDVKLNSGNIGGIVNFKLLVPETRKGGAEVVMTEIMRALGYMAPRTRLMTATVNGSSGTYLFQEKVVKELVERSNQRESVIVEVDEQFFERSWIADSDVDTRNVDLLVFARVANGNWPARGSAHVDIATRAVNLLTRSLHGTWANGPMVMDESFLDGRRHLSSDYLANYRLLLSAFGATHGLITHNRKFYFDPLNERLLPIYYDGDSLLLDDDFFVTPMKEGYEFSREAIAGISDTNFAQSVDMIRSLNAETLATAISDSGYRIEPSEVERILIASIKRLEEARSSDIKLPGYDDIIPFHGAIKTNFKLAFGDHSKGFEVCDPTLSDCAPQALTTEEQLQLLDGGLTDGKIPIKFAGASRSEYLHQSSPLNSPAPITDITYQNFTLTIIGNPEFSVNEERRTLNATLLNGMDRVIIQDGLLDSWTLNVSGLSVDETDSLERIDNFLQTGCLTISDSFLKETRIFVDGATCEDGLNIVRSNGDTARIEVVNTAQDGLDIDFSNLDVGTLRVSRAGNDCVDLSAGKYAIQKMELDTCADKGLSVGEGAEVLIDEAVIRNATLALVAKDSSHLTVQRGRVSSATLCLAAYRKKQEFGTPKLRVEPDICRGQPQYLQDSK